MKERDAETVQKDSRLYALVADMYSIMSKCEGMKADNLQRESCGHAMAWSGEYFLEAAERLARIAAKFRSFE